MPIVPILRATIDATPSGHLAYVVSTRGAPHKETSFGSMMKTWCNAAGLPHRSAHGPRKAGATIAADNCSTEAG